MTSPRHDSDPSMSAGDRALLDLGRALRATGYSFTTVTPLTQERVNNRPGAEWATNAAGVFGWSRPFRTGTIPETLLALMRSAGVLIEVPEGWRSAVRLSSLGQQLFFHSAFPTLSADAVFFGPDTVRFVHAIHGHLAVRTHTITQAVDVGCGAGPGGIAVAAAAPDARVLMVDINEAALRMARVNAALNDATNAGAQRSDILTQAEGSFDLIVSNPPYLVDAAKRAYRHGGGRLGEGLSLAILRAAVARLSRGGTLLLYTGSAIVDGVDAFRTAAEAILVGNAFRWSYVEVDPDVFGEELTGGLYATADRIAAVVLTVTRND